MRAILIDPEKRTLTEVQLSGKSIKEIQDILKCDAFTGAAYLRLSDGFDSICASDDLLDERSEDPKFWFQVDAERIPPTSYPVAGLGLAHGTDEQGRMCDVSIIVEALAKRITFTRRKFRGFKVNDDDPGVVLVTIDAPIIDDGVS